MRDNSDSMGQALYLVPSLSGRGLNLVDLMSLFFIVVMIVGFFQSCRVSLSRIVGRKVEMCRHSRCCSRCVLLEGFVDPRQPTNQVPAFPQIIVRSSQACKHRLRLRCLHEGLAPAEQQAQTSGIIKKLNAKNFRSFYPYECCMLHLYACSLTLCLGRFISLGMWGLEERRM